MAYTTVQRFISGISVYDTFNGLDGIITQMNLNALATHPLCLTYVGPYFVTTFSDSSDQLFTIQGRRIMSDGTILQGVTLLTQPEVIALISQGYPKT